MIQCPTSLPFLAKDELTPAELAGLYAKAAKEYHRCMLIHNGLVENIEKRQQEAANKTEKPVQLDAVR